MKACVLYYLGPKPFNIKGGGIEYYFVFISFGSDYFNKLLGNNTIFYDIVNFLSLPIYLQSQKCNSLYIGFNYYELNSSGSITPIIVRYLIWR